MDLEAAERLALLWAKRMAPDESEIATTIRGLIARIRETPTQKLEQWLAGSRCRWVQIGIDDGFGARSWEVTLGDRLGKIEFHLNPADDNLDDAILGALAKYAQERAA